MPETKTLDFALNPFVPTITGLYEYLLRYDWPSTVVLTPQDFWAIYISIPPNQRNLKADLQPDGRTWFGYRVFDLTNVVMEQPVKRSAHMDLAAHPPLVTL